MSVIGSFTLPLTSISRHINKDYRQYFLIEMLTTRRISAYFFVKFAPLTLAICHRFFTDDFFHYVVCNMCLTPSKGCQAISRTLVRSSTSLYSKLFAAIDHNEQLIHYVVVYVRMITHNLTLQRAVVVLTVFCIALSSSLFQLPSEVTIMIESSSPNFDHLSPPLLIV